MQNKLKNRANPHFHRNSLLNENIKRILYLPSFYHIFLTKYKHRGTRAGGIGFIYYKRLTKNLYFFIFGKEFSKLCQRKNP